MALGLEKIKKLLETEFSSSDVKVIGSVRCIKYYNKDNTARDNSMHEGFTLHEEISLDRDNLMRLYFDIGDKYQNIPKFQDLIEEFGKEYLDPSSPLKIECGKDKHIENRYYYKEQFFNYDDSENYSKYVFEKIELFHNDFAKYIIDVLDKIIPCY